VMSSDEFEDAICRQGAIVEYKPDWEETKKRYVAWWNHEEIGRAGICVTAPKDNTPDMREPSPQFDPANDPEYFWTDLDYWSEVNAWAHRRTFYGGEAFPSFSSGYPGHNSLPAFLGCPVELKEDAGWLHPILEDDTWNPELFEIDTKGRWWEYAMDRARRLSVECSKSCIAEIGAFYTAGDTLAALRGNERLMIDCIEQPDLVRKSLQALFKIWCEMYETIRTEIAYSDGMTCWFTLWSPGTVYALACDFAYMISPKMFEEIFLPVIQQETESLDHCIYHVDGVGNFNHVPALCELPGLNALQILPGAGQPSPLYFMDILKHVQSRGKNLHITIPPEEAEQALESLSSRGLMINTTCRTEHEARQLLKNVQEWSHD